MNTQHHRLGINKRDEKINWWIPIEWQRKVKRITVNFFEETTTINQEWRLGKNPSRAHLIFKSITDGPRVH